MTLDCRIYQQSLRKVEYLMTGSDTKSIISRVSGSTHIPAAAVCLYLITFKFPDDQSLKDNLKSLVSFYSYTNLIPFDPI